MGRIIVRTEGSFGETEIGNIEIVASAENGGHADAVSQVIEKLAKDVLPAAIAQDVRLAKDNVNPKTPFGCGAREGTTIRRVVG